MAKVELIEYTGNGNSDHLHAARLLVYTKNTRINMETDGSWNAIMNEWSEEGVLEQIRYMANTIPSSWEFVDMTFLMTGVSRSTAQQITRTRTASFAMQSQRVVDMSDVTYDNPGKDGPMHMSFAAHANDAIAGYNDMVREGMPLEDARDLLPIGVHCNLVAKYNLRTLVELCVKRDSLRVQGQYVDIIRQMKEATLRVWPWAAPFFVPKNDKAAKLIEEVALELRKHEGLNGAVYNGLSGKLAKAADLVKG